MLRNLIISNYKTQIKKTKKLIPKRGQQLLLLINFQVTSGLHFFPQPSSLSPRGSALH